MYAPPTRSHNNLTSGIGYFIDGIRLLLHPQLRLFILVPLLVNSILFVVLTGFFLTYIFSFFGADVSIIPEWLAPWVAPFKWIAWIICGALFLIVYAYSFNMITNIIAAPFYGLLAERTEKLLTGQELKAESLTSMIARVTGREIQKLIYFLIRGILVILLMVLVSFIPVIQTAAPLIGLAWGAWSMAIQYADYAADNNQRPFYNLRMRLWKRMYSSLGFGGVIISSTLIPVINILAMPAAVVGGTIFWVSELKNCDQNIDGDCFACELDENK